MTFKKFFTVCVLALLSHFQNSHAQSSHLPACSTQQSQQQWHGCYWVEDLGAGLVFRAEFRNGLPHDPAATSPPAGTYVPHYTFTEDYDSPIFNLKGTRIYLNMADLATRGPQRKASVLMDFRTRYAISKFSGFKSVTLDVIADCNTRNFSVENFRGYFQEQGAGFSLQHPSISPGSGQVIEQKRWNDPNYKTAAENQIKAMINQGFEKICAPNIHEQVRTARLNREALANTPVPQQNHASVADRRRRMALVIGNSNYSNLTRLDNAANDARMISAALQSVGFGVSYYENIDLLQMQNAIRTFGEKLGKDDVGLFYFAGHGVQVKGKNYLIPIKENIKKSFEVPTSAVDADLILATLENVKNDLNIVILDACRSSFPGESRSANSRGLANMEAAKGTLIAYATAPGKEASDGTGSNSPYTKNLAQMIQRRGLPIEQVFKEVRKAVVTETGGEQVPWENSSIMGDFYFMAPPRTP